MFHSDSKRIGEGDESWKLLDYGNKLIAYQIKIRVCVPYRIFSFLCQSPTSTTYFEKIFDCV